MNETSFKPQQSKFIESFMLKYNIKFLPEFREKEYQKFIQLLKAT